ncbi:hypothetical protein GWR57_07165 [Bacillus subtilis subsp. subtilis]|uniref:hypothetical protein n=1 Tax=Bacillus subtilis TaxID=1423 RepID=UPI0010A9C33A|nr:hypothetical protein [Bacillus subtilis]NCT23825.1 hypothetical protein [Bacillus subtilis subsp. subtilis]TII14748.1 hypothetical protein C6Y43_13995 [Bacillus subtilis]
MLQVYRYDEDLLFVEPVIVTEMDEVGNYVIPADCTEVELPDSPSLFKPKFDSTAQTWIESATQEEIDAILNTGEVEESPVRLLQEQNALLLSQLAETQQQSEEQANMYAELIMSLTEKGVL